MVNRMLPFLTPTSPKQLLLIDGIGAVVSAFFLGVILVRLHNIIGMPEHLLLALALAPCFFAMYSFGCYYFLRANWATHLKVIAICNLLYCMVTMVLVYCNFETLTALGLLYFGVELIIILILVRVELRSSSTSV